jgi:molybdopterin-guanine dinucleotide biosynthesis protein A
MKQPAGVILAGGLATRMGGGDKCLLPLGGAPMLAGIVARLQPQVAELALNANGDASRFAGFDLPVVRDSVDGFVGPLAGVLAGLDWAAQAGHESIVTAAGDTPFFPQDLVARLMAACAGMAHPLALACTPDGRQPTFGLWPVALREDLRAALTGGLRKVVLWTDRHGGQMAEFPETLAFFNINTPDELAQAEAML